VYNPIFEGGATHVGCWPHARRYFFDARVSDPGSGHEALARIRALYAVEREARGKGLTGADLAAYRQEYAGPVLAAFADWLAEQRPRVLPKSAIGEAVADTSNQWAALGVYLTDGRRNWLHVAGDGGLKAAAVLRSIAASVKRHRVDPWKYLAHVLAEVPGRPAGADLADLLPDGGRFRPAAG
jgi:hypothetical protein